MSSRVEWRALQLGAAAREALADGLTARVFAAFERSCYVETRAGIACVGDARIGRGPLNVVVATPGAMPAVGTRVRLRIEDAVPWTPPSPARRLRADALTFPQARQWRARRPADGLAAMVDAPGALPPRLRRAAQAFVDWLAAGADGPAPRAASGLIGLGPGLTPAGDDFIGGALIALCLAGQRATAGRVADWTLARSGGTGRISAAHLACAARGEGHEALHRMLASLRKPGPAFASALGALDRVGHTSGWDAAAGALRALEKRGQSPFPD